MKRATNVTPLIGRRFLSLVSVHLLLVFSACGENEAIDSFDTTTESAATGSGDSGEGTGGSGGNGENESTVPVIDFACPGSALTEGSNVLVVDGTERTVLLKFPEDTITPAAVVFSWHGFGDSATNFQLAINFNPDFIEGIPAIIVTPEDNNLQPPEGFDWNVFSGAADQPNIDAKLFESVLGCLAEQYEIDASRIYTFGYSAGAIMSNLLYSRYQNLIAASASYSGVWLNDPAETETINTLGIEVSYNWDSLDPSLGGNVLLSHGGDDDEYYYGSAKIIDFEDAAQAAFPFLSANGFAVVDCAHTDGHAPNPNVSFDNVLRYLTDHRFGQSSPYLASDLPEHLDTCELREPE